MVDLLFGEQVIQDLQMLELINFKFELLTTL